MMPAMPAATTLPPPVFDPAEAYPDLHRLRAALTGRDWPGVRGLLDGADPLTRTVLIRSAAELDDLEEFLSGVLTADPDDATASALLGGHLTDVAWKIRSSAKAEQVSREQFRDFHAGLRRAEQVLIDGAARTPGDVTLWVQRMPTARGLQLGLSEVQRRYDRAAALDPHHLPAQQHMLQSLCPKWSGTHEQMHAFARRCMETAPKGAPNAAIVAYAHVERWLELDGAAADRYLAGPFARNEIYEAATRSVWDPAFRPGPGWVWVRNVFAFLFSLLGDERAAAAQFQALGPLASPDPWHYLGAEAREFVKRRDRAYAKAGLR